MESFAKVSLAFHVSDNGRNPNSIETHVLYVVELVDNALIRSTTVLAGRGVTGRAGTVGGRKAVRYQLRWTW